MSVRVRYAPSPTGEPHVGNIRAALFNWLLARHEGGTFILRIEDTDQARIVPDALEAIFDSLRWLGLDWDEGPEVGGPHAPYFQSQRLEHYHRASEQLIAADNAYRCYCSPERLEEVRAEQMRYKQPPKYDRRCRKLSPAERRELEAQGIPPVVRFKTPLSGQTTFHDLVRGNVTFENDTLDDFVLLKSDGFPTYHLANVVDDHLMGITHVLRGDEWVSSTPRHVLMYQAFGWQPPVFAHLPMILGPDRAKLSKRHGDTSILQYRDKGFLPHALFNFLGLLGWSLDDKTEIISRQDFIRHFSLERIVKNPAIFNMDKVTWMNGTYIREMGLDELAEQLAPFLEEHLPTDIPRPIDRPYLQRIVPLIQERIKRFDEAADLTDFFFREGELTYPIEDLLDKRFADQPQEAAEALAAVRERIAALDRWDEEALESVIRPLAAELGLKTGELFGAIRVAVTGRTAAPPLFQTMAVLGRERALSRLTGASWKLLAESRLYQTLFPRLFAYVLDLVGSVRTAEEVAAKVFERGFRESVQAQPTPAAAIKLLTIARDELTEHRRTTLAPEIRYQAREEAVRELMKLVTELPEEDQHIVALRFDVQLTYGQIAAVMGLSEARVRARLQATLQNLRARMERFDEEMLGPPRFDAESLSAAVAARVSTALVT